MGPGGIRPRASGSLRSGSSSGAEKIMVDILLPGPDDLYRFADGPGNLNRLFHRIHFSATSEASAQIGGVDVDLFRVKPGCLGSRLAAHWSGPGREPRRRSGPFTPRRCSSSVPWWHGPGRAAGRRIQLFSPVSVRACLTSPSSRATTPVYSGDPAGSYGSRHYPVRDWSPGPIVLTGRPVPGGPPRNFGRRPPPRG